MAKCSKSNEERISHLPDNVLHQILSLLPLTQAAKTSILAKRWRYLWTHISCLDMDQRCSKPEAFPINMLIALFHLSGPTAIQKVHLKVEKWHQGSKNAYDQLVRFAAGKNVQELYLDFSAGDSNATFFWGQDWCLCYAGNGYRDYEVYFGILTGIPLCKLSLKNCFVKLCDSVDFRLVESLWLTMIRVMERTPNFLEHIVSSCPLLKNLGLEGDMYWGGHMAVTSIRLSCSMLRTMTVKCCPRLQEIEIDAPHIEYFEYRGRLQGALRLVRSPDLACASISFCEMRGIPGDMIKSRDFLQNFACAKFLTICFNSVERLLMTKDLTEGSPDFSRLKQLELRGKLHHRTVIIMITNLLLATPNLEHLSLSLVPNEKEQYQDCGFDEQVLLDSQKVRVSCLHHHLEGIEVSNFKGCKIETLMVKYLLQNAMILKELIIHSDRAYFSHHLEIKRMLSNWQVNPDTKITYC